MNDLHPAEIAKLEAEAIRAMADAEQAKAEAENSRALARGATLSAEREALSLASDQRKEAAYLAGDFANRVIHFTDEVSDKSVGSAIEKLSTWSRLDPGCDMRVVFNSPGGSVVDGMYLFDHIRQLGASGHRVTTVSMGMSASMAGILIQSGTRRIMGKQAWLMIHEVSMWAAGSLGSLEDTIGWGKKLGDRIVGIFYERSRDSEKPLSRIQLAKKFERKDWFVSSDEALAHGFVDEVF